MISFKKEKLTIEAFIDRNSMAKKVANDLSETILSLLEEKKEINIMFAAAPSQNEFLEELSLKQNIDWSRITAFHLDEYIGLEENSPQKFGFFLKERIFDKVPFSQVHYLDGNAMDCDEECSRYAGLIKEAKIDIACIGIGENGHLAFNDPHVADFNDSRTIKVVELDNKCRQQQVNDKCFLSIDDVPEYAYTVTIPTIMSADSIFCIVPGASKAQAVYDTLYAPVEEKCPATILRTKENAKLYLDSDSSSLLVLSI